MQLGIIAGTTAQDFEYVQSLGLKNAEFCCNVGNNAQEFAAQADQIQVNIAKYGVKVCSVGRWGTKRLLEDGSFNQEEFQQDLALIDMASAVGSPYFVCGCNKASNAFSREENIDFAIAYFRTLAEYAEPKNVKILVYNCDWNNFIYDKSSWDIVFPAVPALGLKYDTSHCINRGGDYLEEIRTYGNLIGHFHLKGTVRINGKNIPDPPAGMDDIAWGAVIATLYYRKYNGVLSIEPHSSVWTAGALGSFGVKFTVEYFQKYVFEDDGNAPAKQFMP